MEDDNDDDALDETEELTDGDDDIDAEGDGDADMELLIEEDIEEDTEELIDELGEGELEGLSDRELLIEDDIELLTLLDGLEPSWRIIFPPSSLRMNSASSLSRKLAILLLYCILCFFISYNTKKPTLGGQ